MGYFYDKLRYMGMEQGMILLIGVVFEFEGENIIDNYIFFVVENKEESNIMIFFNKLSIELNLKMNDFLGMNIIVIDCDDLIGDEDLSNEIDGLVIYDVRVIEL